MGISERTFLNSPKNYTGYVADESLVKSYFVGSLYQSKGEILMIIIIRKASTFYGKIILTDKNNNRIIISENDKLIFSVKKSLKNNDNDIVITKVLYDYDRLNEAYPFVLSAEETDITSGTYYYDVGLQCSNGEFYHVTTPDEFIIEESIARKDVLT